MKSLVQDIRYGLRILRRNRGFSFLVTLILALGIGACTAIFSAVHAVLLRPLPYRDPNRLVAIWNSNPKIAGGARMPISYPDFLDWKNQNRVFVEMAAIALFPNTVNCSGGGDPERFSEFSVSEGFFTILGVQPLLGRTFLTEECQPSGNPVVVLSYGLWQRRFGASPNILGQSMTLNGEAHTVIGVMPSHFKFEFKLPFANVTLKSELWRPLARVPDWMNNRNSHLMTAIARLKPGITLERAQTDMTTLARRQAQLFPDTNANFDVRTANLKESQFGFLRPTLLSLLAAVGFVLLIACTNIANLLLARAAGREKEIAIRTALGAGRLRVVRQLLTESLILAVLGGVLGLLVSQGGIDLIDAYFAYSKTVVPPIQMDISILSFTLLITLLAGITFGLTPALQFSRVNLNETLKGGGRSSTSDAPQGRLKNLLVISEVMLSLVLLIGAGLLIRSFLRMSTTSLGFRPENVLTMGLNLSESQYPQNHQRVTFFQQLLERVVTLPGVVSAGLTSHLPSAGAIGNPITIEGRPQAAAGSTPRENITVVSPLFFNTLAIPLKKGRLFTDQDNENSQPVAIISESMVHKYWGNQDPLGMRINGGIGGPWLSIVGVVGDFKQEGLVVEHQPQICVPYRQVPLNPMNLLVRTAKNPLNLAAAVKGAIHALDPNQPVADIQTMEKVLDDSVGLRRLVMSIMGIFAAFAFVLALGGIYGVMTYFVAQRTRGIGIRMALGARPGQVLWMVLRQGLTLIVVGVGLGLAGAFSLTRFLSNQLFGITPNDPLTFAGVSLSLAGIALLACYVPARRATKVDPMVALRDE